QLHRWGSPDVAATYLARAARATTGTLVVNREDPHLRGIVAEIGWTDAIPAGGRPEVRMFGVADSVLADLPHGLGSAPAFGIDAPRTGDADTTQVTAYQGLAATIRLGEGGPAAGATLEVRLPSKGIHLAVDSAAALEAARVILGSAFDAEVAVA